MQGDNIYSENRQFIPKKQLVVRTKCYFCCDLRETYVKTKKQEEKFIWNQNAKARFETLKVQIFNYLPLYWIYRGMCGLKSERSYAFLCFFL